MKQKKLILLTSEFPFGKGETFLETEITFLSEAFEQILIYSCATSTEVKRDLPANVDCKLFSSQLTKRDKLFSLVGLFSKDVRSEKKRVTEVYKREWTKGIRNTALVSIFVGNRWKKVLEKEMLNSSDFDLTFYSYWCTDTAIGLSLLRKAYPSVKAFSRVHRWDLYFEATTFDYQPYRDLIAKNLTGLFPISDMGARYIKDEWKVQPNSIHVSRLGTRETIQSQSKPNKNILVSCSNVVPLKRVELIAESLNFVDGIELEWFHFGDGLAYSKLEKRTEELNGGRIKVHLMGSKENREVLAWFELNSPSLFVNVSTTEGIPVSIMEAMSFGTPVFATNVGGTSEIVTNENGRLLDPHITAQELGKMIQSFFLMQYEDRSEMRRKAFETWNTKYNASTNYTAFVQEILR